MQNKTENSIGIGYQKAIDNENVLKIEKGIRISQFNGIKLKNVAWPDKPMDITNNKIRLLNKKYLQRMGLSWHFLMNGDKLIK